MSPCASHDTRLPARSLARTHTRTRARTHAQAMHHVREAQGALLELRALVQQAGMAMQPVLTCDNDAFVPSPWLLLAAAAASSALMASSATYWALNRKETDAWRRTLPPTRTHAD